MNCRLNFSAVSYLSGRKQRVKGVAYGSRPGILGPCPRWDFESLSFGALRLSHWSMERGGILNQLFEKNGGQIANLARKVLQLSKHVNVRTRTSGQKYGNYH